MAQCVDELVWVDRGAKGDVLIYLVPNVKMIVKKVRDSIVNLPEGA